MLPAAQDFGPFGPVVGYGAAIIAASGALGLTWRGALKKWKPPEEDLPNVAQKLLLLCCGIGIVIIWYSARPNTVLYLFIFGIIASILCVIAFLGYAGMVGKYTFIKRVQTGSKKLKDVRILGGRKLLPQAKAIMQQEGLTSDQELFERMVFDPDKLWNRQSRQWVKTWLIALFMILGLTGTLALSAVGFATQVILTGKPAASVIRAQNLSGAQMDALWLQLSSESNTSERSEITATLKAWAIKYGYSLEQAQKAVEDWTAEVIKERKNSKDLPRAYFLRDKLDAIAASPVARSDERKVETSGMILKKIRPGNFLMGSPKAETGSESDERPQTQVTITYTFWMGKYEVTQGQYDAVRAHSANMADNPSMFNGNRTNWNLLDYGRNQERPVDNITWEEASTFCVAFTETERSRIPANFEFRLPTEAEWEFACRAGTVTRFSFGDDESRLGEYAWFKSNSDKRTQPVGQKRPNPWGLYDMHGNVMEWCLDWYATNLPGGIVTDPFGPSHGKKRVLRGGSWQSGEAREFRCADRFGLEPTTNGWAYGFRVVLGPSFRSLSSPK